MRELNNFCTSFVVGSDQLFNDNLYNDLDQWITLDWVSDNKKKIAYAASYGHDYIWSSESTRAKMSFFMKKFDAFSVREKSGVELSKKEFGIEAEWVLDPVFLCDTKHYLELASKSTIERETPYIGAYILDPNKEKEEIIRYVMDKLSLPSEIFRFSYM